MLMTRELMRHYVNLPRHLQVRIIYNIGVESNLNWNESEHEVNIQFFQFCKDFKLSSRLAYEIDLMVEYLTTQ